MQLTNDAQRIVSRLRAHYQALLGGGYTPNNAADRVRFDNGDVPADLVCLALGNPYDVDGLAYAGLLVRRGRDA